MCPAGHRVEELRGSRTARTGGSGLGHPVASGRSRDSSSPFAPCRGSHGKAGEQRWRRALGAGRLTCILPRARKLWWSTTTLQTFCCYRKMLRRKGYAVRQFQRGRQALESARNAAPDLILLDINMPELNGYETCKLFKQNPALAAIPVIFLSAVSETEGK